MIEIIPYQARWPEEFAAIATRLAATLGERALAIDHIGSTAVPNLAAKDIIDVQITVSDLTPFAPLRDAVTVAGFNWRSDVNGDHVPPGYDGRVAYWAKRYFTEKSGDRRTHIHMRVAGRPNQRYALLFRDYLRAHALAAAAYAQVKRRLAAYHGQETDHIAYVTLKDPVCDLIMVAAEAWADQVGWRNPFAGGHPT